MNYEILIDCQMKDISRNYDNVLIERTNRQIQQKYLIYIVSKVMIRNLKRIKNLNIRPLFCVCRM